MKSINTLLSALFFLGAIVGITSCTEEADYTPAQKPENAQVYFATDEASTVSLETGQQSFMVSIYRISLKGALTVNITSQDESGIFTIPSSVTFAEGTTKAEIPVSFDFDKLEPEKKYPISFAIDGNSELSEYGNSELVLNVQYAPWGAWEKFGTGVYTYSLYWGGKDSYDIYRKQSLLDANQFQFKISPWGANKDTELIIDYNKSTNQAKVYRETQVATHSTYGAVYVSDIVYYIDNIEGKTGSYEKYPCTFNPETGLFSLNLIYYVGAGYFGQGVETFQLDGFKQYDYSITMTNKGNYIDLDKQDNAVIGFVAGTDVDFYRYVLVAGALSDNEIDKVANGIIDGSIESAEVKGNNSIAFPLSEAGKYTVVAVTYNENEEVQLHNALIFDFEPAGKPNPWVSLGNCGYTDDFVFTSYFETESADDVASYPVEIYENKEQPGMFRLQNPYGPESFYGEVEGAVFADGNHNIVINATDPEGVYIELQSTGLDLGDAEIGIYSMAGYYLDEGKTLEEVKVAGVCGTYKNNIITFPKEALAIVLGEKMYKANIYGAWKIDMNALQKTNRSVSTFNWNSLQKSVFAGNSLMSVPDYRIMHVRGQKVDTQRVVKVRNFKY